jgi:xanthine dehydrogenase accessory factor
MADDPGRAPAGREQSWTDEPPQGRVVVVTDNPVGRAVRQIAEVAGREALLLDDEASTPLQWLHDHPLDERDALVLADHDTPGMEQLLRAALAGRCGYVAMLGSRRRAAMVHEMLADLPEQVLRRLHVPAGLDTGGKAPGEIALSVVAEVVATAHGRTGRPMRDLAR